MNHGYSAKDYPVPRTSVGEETQTPGSQEDQHLADLAIEQTTQTYYPTESMEEGQGSLGRGILYALIPALILWALILWGVKLGWFS